MGTLVWISPIVKIRKAQVYVSCRLPSGGVYYWPKELSSLTSWKGLSGMFALKIMLQAALDNAVPPYYNSYETCLRRRVLNSAGRNT